jgi:hypothetical protein
MELDDGLDEALLNGEGDLVLTNPNEMLADDGELADMELDIPTRAANAGEPDLVTLDRAEAALEGHAARAASVASAAATQPVAQRQPATRQSPQKTATAQAQQQTTGATPSQPAQTENQTPTAAGESPATFTDADSETAKALAALPVYIEAKKQQRLFKDACKGGGKFGGSCRSSSGWRRWWCGSRWASAGKEEAKANARMPNLQTR